MCGCASDPPAATETPRGPPAAPDRSVAIAIAIAWTPAPAAPPVMPPPTMAPPPSAMPPAVPFAIPIGGLDAGGCDRLLDRGGGAREGGGWRARSGEHRCTGDGGDRSARLNAQDHGF